MNSIPKRLKDEPLIEAIWQVQFDDAQIGDVLPGILYGSLQREYGDMNFIRLPAADIPPLVAQIDQNLRFAAKFRIEYLNSPLLWQIGDHIVTVNCRKPYIGWRKFKEAILGLVENLKTSGINLQATRHSLRYIDLLMLESVPDISSINLQMKLGGHEVLHNNLQMRLEIPEDGYVHVIQIATPANANLPEGPATGTLVDIETFSTTPLQGWDELDVQMEELHDRSKEIFFMDILRKETIERFDPEF